MSENCNCPCCRHHKGELTDKEYAWYLKGLIEMSSRIPKSIKEYCKSDKATKQEHDFEMSLWDDSVGARITLKELIEKMSEAGIEVDPAFLTPERYTLPNNEVKDGSEQHCETENQ
jgi:hypothetical protein